MLYLPNDVSIVINVSFFVLKKEEYDVHSNLVSFVFTPFLQLRREGGSFLTTIKILLLAGIGTVLHRRERNNLVLYGIFCFSFLVILTYNRSKRPVPCIPHTIILLKKFNHVQFSTIKYLFSKICSYKLTKFGLVAYRTYRTSSLLRTIYRFYYNRELTFYFS